MTGNTNASVLHMRLASVWGSCLASTAITMRCDGVGVFSAPVMSHNRTPLSVHRRCGRRTRTHAPAMITSMSTCWCGCGTA